MAVYGRNVLTTEGEDWRIHRKITAPTFSEVNFCRPSWTIWLTFFKSNNKLVCQETISALEGLFETWGGKDCVEIGNVTDVTVAVSLFRHIKDITCLHCIQSLRSWWYLVQVWTFLNVNKNELLTIIRIWHPHPMGRNRSSSRSSNG